MIADGKWIAINDPKRFEAGVMKPYFSLYPLNRKRQHEEVSITIRFCEALELYSITNHFLRSDRALCLKLRRRPSMHKCYLSKAIMTSQQVTDEENGLAVYHIIAELLNECLYKEIRSVDSGKVPFDERCHLLSRLVHLATQRMTLGLSVVTAMYWSPGLLKTWSIRIRQRKANTETEFVRHFSRCFHCVPQI